MGKFLIAKPVNELLGAKCPWALIDSFFSNKNQTEIVDKKACIDYGLWRIGRQRAYGTIVMSYEPLNPDLAGFQPDPDSAGG